MYFKLDGYHKESKLGYRDNRGTRRRRCIPVFTTFGKGATSRWRGVRFHEGFLTRHKGSPSSPSLSHEGIAHLLVVDFKVVFKPSQTFHGANHKTNASGRP